MRVVLAVLHFFIFVRFANAQPAHQFLPGSLPYRCLPISKNAAVSFDVEGTGLRGSENFYRSLLTGPWDVVRITSDLLAEEIYVDVTDPGSPAFARVKDTDGELAQLTKDLQIPSFSFGNPIDVFHGPRSGLRIGPAPRERQNFGFTFLRQTRRGLLLRFVHEQSPYPFKSLIVYECIGGEWPSTLSPQQTAHLLLRTAAELLDRNPRLMFDEPRVAGLPLENARGATATSAQFSHQLEQVLTNRIYVPFDVSSDLPRVSPELLATAGGSIALVSLVVRFAGAFPHPGARVASIGISAAMGAGMLLTPREAAAAQQKRLALIPATSPHCSVGALRRIRAMRPGSRERYLARYSDAIVCIQRANEAIALQIADGSLVF